MHLGRLDFFPFAETYEMYQYMYSSGPGWVQNIHIRKINLGLGPNLSTSSSQTLGGGYTAKMQDGRASGCDPGGYRDEGGVLETRRTDRRWRAFAAAHEHPIPSHDLISFRLEIVPLLLAGNIVRTAVHSSP